MSKELLLEIGHEEIPASYMGPALSQIKTMAQKYLPDAGFSFSKIITLGTPRRMVLCVANLESKKDAAGELAKILPRIILGISFPKSMRWNTYNIRFARPIRWMVALYDDKVIDFPFEGLKPNRFSYGHRFLAPDKFEVKNFSQYQQELKKRFVIVDQKERKNLIKNEIESTAKEFNGRVAPDERLLEIVNWLVEYPVVLLGSFKKEFLVLPKEVLMTSMRSHQKYFSLVDDKNNLLPYFITISNMRVADPKVIVKGNEKVLTARLTDAQFLYNADKKTSLEKRVEKLKTVTFAEKLGTMHEKTRRIVKLADFILTLIDKKIKPAATRVAYLCKADLVSEMVGEFPDLQGVIGKYYAKLSGEKDIVAQAIGEHYLPRHANDNLPETIEGAVVSLSDKLDTLVGYFALGLKPTATEDPYALRRQALGILQIIWNKEFKISLNKILSEALGNYGKIVKNKKKTEKELMEFMAVRLENILESKKIPKNIIEAILSMGSDNLILTKKKISALNSARTKKEFEQFKMAFKRVRNILGGKIIKKSIKVNLLKEQAEKDLHKAYLSTEKDFAKQIKNNDYSKALETLMGLAPAINKFFDDVLVMVKDKKTKDNRAALLGNIYLMAQEIADFKFLI